jgi:hypothetical protein
MKGDPRNVTHRYTNVIPSKYEQVSSAPDTVPTDDQQSPQQPRSNRDLKYLKHYTFKQLVGADHPQPCSTMYYSQVQKRQWTQLSDTWEVVEWSSTPVSCRMVGPCWWQGSTVSMETQTLLRYPNGQNQDMEYWVLKKVEVCGCGLW